MLRLAHRILSQSVLAPEHADPGSFAAYLEIVRRGIASQPAFIVDNVAEFMWSTPDKGWDVDKDFPSLAPPYQWFFMEYQHVLPGDPLLQSGWAVQSLDLTKDAALIESQFGAAFHSRCVDKGVRWSVVCGLFVVNRRDGRIGFPGYEARLGVGGDGSIRDWSVSQGVDPTERSAPLLPVLLAISFMHCKNVTHADASAAENPSEKWLKRQRAPRVEYKVLDISPARKILHSEGNLAQEGLRRALHLCRGHFATYTEESPLFGKYVGQFWKPAHVRGSIEQGAVVKDYNVKPQ